LIYVIANSELLGDSLMISGHINSLKNLYGEVNVICSNKVAPVFELMKVDNIIYADIQNYSQTSSVLSSIEKSEFIINYNYSKSSYHFVKDLLNKGIVSKAYGFESHEIDKAMCNEIYTQFIGLEEWDASVRNQPSCYTLGRLLPRINSNLTAQAPIIHLNKASLSFKSTIDKPYACFLPGSGEVSKRWPLLSFMEVAKQIKAIATPVFIFGPNENQLQKEFFENNKDESINALYGLSLSELAAVLSVAAFVVSNDSGPMHLSCAVGTSTIALFGSTNSKEWFPYDKTKHMVIEKDCAGYETCDKCDKRNTCIQDISIEEVLNEVDNVLN